MLNCNDCQRRPSSPAIKRPLTLKTNHKTPIKKQKTEADVSDTTISSANELSGTSEQNSPENLCKHDRACPRIPLLHSTPLTDDNTIRKQPDTSSGSDRDTPQAFHAPTRHTPPSTDTSDSSFENLTARKPLRRPLEMPRKGIFERNEIYNSAEKRFPICCPIPQLDGRKKLAGDEVFVHDLRKNERDGCPDPVSFILYNYT